MVPECLKRIGFTNVSVVAEQATPDGNFPTVPSPNPEEHAAMALALAQATREKAEMVMATDPDTDRVGIGIKNATGDFFLLNGNQAFSLLMWFVLKHIADPKGKYIVKTIVTTELVDTMAAHFGVTCYNTLTGFKYIAELMGEREGKEKFVAAGEESYGVMVGDFVRDKDAVSACAFFSAMAAVAKDENKTLYDWLVQMYIDFGFYKEGLINLVRKGAEGASQINAMMEKFRSQPPSTIAGKKVIRMLDYQTSVEKNLATGASSRIALPVSDVLQFYTDTGNKISVRPSGTEPKIKFYVSVKENCRQRKILKKSSRPGRRDRGHRKRAHCLTRPDEFSTFVGSMKKVAFYTLGCKLNYSETSTLSRKFEDAGFRKVEFTDHPDIFIINTCSVTENADKKCRKVVREARSISPDAYVAIVGCYAQLKPAEIAQIPGVDAVLGAAEKFRLLELLGTFERKSTPEVFSTPVTSATAFHASYSLNDRTRTFLKVQDGCDYSCAFCTIPQARGASRSSSIEEIVAAAKGIIAQDVKEIVLTGVNTGDFGIQNGKRVESFLDLIRALDELSGPTRFRISSVEPNLLSDEIIEFVAQSRRFAPHFHIPLQSGSDKILKLMRRRYLRERYASRVGTIKSLIPHACIGVDIITGFPGETDVDFRDTYDFLHELDVSYLHVFTYSERPNTSATEMPEGVPKQKRHERSIQLHSLSDKKRRLFYEQNLGRDALVLFENDVEDGRMYGFTENYVRVAAAYDPLRVNEFQRVRLCGIADNGAVVVEEVEHIENLII